METSVIKIQRWYRYNKYNDNWWPVNSYTGSINSYNKWLQPNKHTKQKYICFDCIIM